MMIIFNGRRSTFTLRNFLIMCLMFAYTGSSFAERVMTESTIDIRGQLHRYFHLYDVKKASDGPVIILIDGSGCRDFSLRFESFFIVWPDNFSAIPIAIGLCNYFLIPCLFMPHWRYL